MEHVDEERLIEHWVDGAHLSAAERTHLRTCAKCQAVSDAIGLLRDELAIARASMLQPAVEAKLVAIFAEAGHAERVTRPLQAMADRTTTWVQAMLLWDSRQQAGPSGVRNAIQSSYRLLFGGQATEVELMVEPYQGNHGALRVIGEVIGSDASAQGGLALIELMAQGDAERAIEAESDPRGHFTLERVPPGTYVMTITPRVGEMLVIESLELT